jgi:ADP-ribose pyrophosphatase
MNSPKALEIFFKCESHNKIAFMQKFETKNKEVVDYFLFDSKTIPVVVFPITENNEVIALRQFRHGANCEIIELPGGNVEDNLTIEQTALKELREETGYSTKEIHQIKQQTWFDPASFRVKFFPVVALRCQKIDDSRLESTEHIETVLKPLHDWIGMIKNNEICDSKSIAVTFLALFDLCPALMDEMVKNVESYLPKQKQ